MTHILKVENTYDVNLSGRPKTDLKTANEPETVAVLPSAIPYIKPKLMVAKGDTVKIGTPIFFDKLQPNVQFTSPVGGTIEELTYGPKRRLDRVIIRRASHEEREPVDAVSVQTASREAVVSQLLKTGFWGVLSSFPFRKIANPAATPDRIIVNLDQDEPYLPQPEVYLKDQESALRTGLAVLSKLSDTVQVTASDRNAWVKSTFSDVITHIMSGAYPANDPGVTYYMTRGREKSEDWFVNGQDLVQIGELFETGQIPLYRIVVVAGSGAKNQQYYRVRNGSPASLIVEAKSDQPVRYIAGGALTGRKTDAQGYLGFREYAWHILPDGSDAQIMPFLKPGFKQPSFSRAFMSSALPQMDWEQDTKINGGERACVACGHCPQVCPVGILPQFMMKSLYAGDLEDALAHGLLDCVECGLCSYVCPSKIELNDIFFQAKQRLEKELRS